MLKEIKSLTLETVTKFKKNPKKLNSELDLIKFFVQQSNLFNGRKKKLYKFINRSKIK
jgi:hypothetical protein